MLNWVVHEKDIITSRPGLDPTSYISCAATLLYVANSARIRLNQNNLLVKRQIDNTTPERLVLTGEL